VEPSWTRREDPQGRFVLTLPQDWASGDAIVGAKSTSAGAAFVAVDAEGETLFEVYCLQHNDLQFYAQVLASEAKRLHHGAEAGKPEPLLLETRTACLRLRLAYRERTFRGTDEPFTTDYYLLDGRVRVVSLHFKTLTARHGELASVFETIARGVELSA